MKISELLMFTCLAFVAGVVACLVGGGILAAIWDMDWTKAESVSAISTSLGAIGTVGTLLFLIIQNRALRHEQKEQLKLIAFQRYQGHKESFVSLLKKLENQYRVTFIDPDELYRNIFPSNSFEFCTLKAFISDSSFLSEAVEIYKRITHEENLSGDIGLGHRNVHTHIHNQLEIQRKMSIRFSSNPELGDLFSTSKVENVLVLNMFGAFQYQRALRGILSELITFSGHYIEIGKITPLARKENYLAFMTFLNSLTNGTALKLESNIALELWMSMYMAIEKNHENKNEKMQAMLGHMRNIALSSEDAQRVLSSRNEMETLIADFNSLHSEERAFIENTVPDEIFSLINRFRSSN
ncbi:hypothetical protein AB6D87_24215 [Vibrio lentus]